MDYSKFMSKLNDEVGNVSVTENGALGYATSGKAILDMNFRITSYRNKTAQEIVRDFSLALDETPVVAIKWLFFARDIRGGAGERSAHCEVIKVIAAPALRAGTATTFTRYSVMKRF